MTRFSLFCAIILLNLNCSGVVDGDNDSPTGLPISLTRHFGKVVSEYYETDLYISERECLSGQCPDKYSTNGFSYLTICDECKNARINSNRLEFLKWRSIASSRTISGCSLSYQNGKIEDATILEKTKTRVMVNTNQVATITSQGSNELCESWTMNAIINKNLVFTTAENQKPIVSINTSKNRFNVAKSISSDDLKNDNISKLNLSAPVNITCTDPEGRLARPTVTLVKKDGEDIAPNLWDLSWKGESRGDITTKTEANLGAQVTWIKPNENSWQFFGVEAGSWTVRASCFIKESLQELSIDTEEITLTVTDSLQE